jgi:tripartite-type tricarboxylate transporter receptor subunit TctC
MEEAGVPNFKVVVWQGFSAPAGTSRAIVDRLNASAREALQAPEVVTRFQELGAERIGSTHRMIKRYRPMGHHEVMNTDLPLS